MSLSPMPMNMQMSQMRINKADTSSSSSLETSCDPEELGSRCPSIILIPSTNIETDSKLFLKMLPHNFYHESPQNGNRESNKNAQVLRSRTSEEEVIIFLKKQNETIDFVPAATTSSIPDATLVVSKADLEAMVHIGAQLSNVSMKLQSTVMGISSVLVNFPGDASVLCISKSIGSSSSLVHHFLMDVLPSTQNYLRFHTNESTRSLDTEQSFNSDLDSKERRPPSFSSLSVKVLQQRNNVESFVPMIPNSTRGHDVETDLMTGKLMFILRPENPDDDVHHYENIFKGKRRRFEVQFQFQLKRLPLGILFCGGEKPGHLKLGLVAKGVSNLILNVLSKMTRHMHYSFGSKDGTEDSRIVFPLWTFVDRLVITKPGDEPPELGKLIHESSQSVKARKASNNTGEWNLNNIYTFSFNSSNIDFPTWNVVNVPLVPDTDLHMFWGDSPLNIVIYDVPNQSKESKHVKSELAYGVNFQVKYVNNESNEDENMFGLEDRILHEDMHTSTHHRIRSIDFGLDESEDLSEFFDAFETEPLMDTSTEQQDSMKSNRLLVSACVEIFQQRDKKYETLYTFAMENSVVFRTYSEFTRYFQLKDKRSFSDYTKNTRLSTIERQRRFMNSYIDALLQNRTRKKIADLDSFLQSSSNLEVNFLNKKSFPNSLMNANLKLYTLIARARSEYHWVEEWAVLTSHHLSFFHPDQRKAQYSIPLLEIKDVRKAEDYEAPCFPNFYFLIVETLGRTTYLIMKSENLVEKWMEFVNIGIQYNLNNNVSNRFLHDTSEEYLHKSSMWKCKNRRILNCRKFVFDPLERNVAATKSPCEQIEEILEKILKMKDDSDEEMMRFLDSVSNLKQVDVSTLDEEDRTVFCLNLYHVMIMHAMIVLSPPSSSFKFSSFFNTVAYQCSDDIFSIAELEHCIIRNNMNAPSHFISKFFIPKSTYSFPLKKIDYRLNFAMNCGSKSLPQHIIIFKRSTLNEQLDFAMRFFLEETIEVRVKKSLELVLEIPKLCDWYMEDFGCKKTTDLVQVLRPFLREDLQQILDETGQLGSRELLIRFSPFSYVCQELALHYEA